VGCDENGSLTWLKFEVRSLRNVAFIKYHPPLNFKLTAPLLQFKNMSQLDLVLYGGELPSELGALSNMRHVSISHYCLGGTLPPNWLEGWPQLGSLTVAPHQDAFGLVPEDAECGVTWPIPMRWQQRKMQELYTLKLHNHRLSGFLPSLNKWPE
jgi:hypothetical protein